MMYLLPVFVICVLAMMKRAEQQRRADAFELSQLTFDALPDDAKDRVRECQRERAEVTTAARAAWVAAHNADLKRQIRIAAALLAFAVIYSVIETFI